jgi:hypothetical protein
MLGLVPLNESTVTLNPAKSKPPKLCVNAAVENKSAASVYVPLGAVTEVDGVGLTYLPRLIVCATSARQSLRTGAAHRRT